MSINIPVFSDDMTLLDRHNKILSDIHHDLDNTDWSKELDRMHHDMLTLAPSQPGRLCPSPTPHKVEKFLSKDIHGRPIFSARFDVRQFEPQEIEVRISENKLKVHAKHEDKDGESSGTIEYSRKVNLPPNIDLKKMNCVLSSDGYLTTEALVSPPNYINFDNEFPSIANITSPTRLLNVNRLHADRTSPRLPRRDYESSPGKFKTEIDVSNFEPEDVKVTTHNHKITIKAKREESIGGRTTSKELNREIAIPKTSDPNKVKAFFSASGKLILEES
ncbi:major egg antigen-like [Argonauta hians]